MHFFYLKIFYYLYIMMTQEEKENNGKLVSVTLEYENYSQTLSGQSAQDWMDWINGSVSLSQIRSDQQAIHDFHKLGI